LLVIPFALTYAFGRMAKDQKQGWVVFAAMFTLWIVVAGLAISQESAGNPELTKVGANQTITATSPGGNAEGKEERFGPAVSGLFAGSTTGTSTGAVNSMHDSFTPLGGMAPMMNMMLGEVSPGGVGAGLYGMLIFVLLAVFIAGLMVGRTPEYLGKKIQAAEMKLVVLYILAVPVAVLAFAGASVVLGGAKASILNPGPHGLSEVVYAYTSAGNNNGSAFAGLSGNTDWYNTTLGLAMLVGRFILIVPALAIAGSLARKQPAPVSAGTFPTGTPLFTGLLVGVVVIVVGLTYFPVLALGPIVEHLGI
jgi:K+-transporting ATPase ATPase A chain